MEGLLEPDQQWLIVNIQIGKCHVEWMRFGRPAEWVLVATLQGRVGHFIATKQTYIAERIIGKVTVVQSLTSRGDIFHKNVVLDIEPQRVVLGLQDAVIQREK